MNRKRLAVEDVARVFIAGLVKSHATTFAKREDDKHNEIECLLDRLCCNGDEKLQAMVKQVGYQMD